MIRASSITRVLAIAMLAFAVFLQFSVLSAPAFADGDPVEECEGDWVLIEYSNPDGHTYSEVECRPASGLQKWLWLVGVLAVGGGGGLRLESPAWFRA